MGEEPPGEFRQFKFKLKFKWDGPPGPTKLGVKKRKRTASKSVFGGLILYGENDYAGRGRCEARFAGDGISDMGYGGREREGEERPVGYRLWGVIRLRLRLRRKGTSGAQV